MSRQWNASSTFIPKSLLDYVKKMMQITSHTFLWRGKSIDEPTKYKHTECWNETMNQPDPYCTVCNGSGFIYDYNTGNQKIMRGVIVPNSPDITASFLVLSLSSIPLESFRSIDLP